MPTLYATGEAYARSAGQPDDADKAVKLGTAVTLGFWIISIPLYLNQRWTKPIWKLCRARSGRDWMVNSGVLRIDDERISGRGHVLAALAFLTYPMWLWLGWRRGLASRTSGR
jgi:hypothetical protein